MAQIYADVILPLPLHRTFTYVVPEAFEANIQRGSRVLVPFGRKKFYTGIVVGTHQNKPTEFEAKEIADLLDSRPIVRYPQLKLWDWIADYYLCSVGEVFKAALPAGLKLESETSVRINPEFEEGTDGELKERERIVLDYISARDKVSLLEIGKSTGFKNVESIVTSLIEKDAVFVSENVVTTYRPKTITCVDLACDSGDNETPKTYFELVRGAKKQEQVLLAFFDLSHRLQRGQSVEVTKDALMKRADASPAIIKAMEKKAYEEFAAYDRYNTLIYYAQQNHPEDYSYHQIKLSAWLKGCPTLDIKELEKEEGIYNTYRFIVSNFDENDSKLKATEK